MTPLPEKSDKNSDLVDQVERLSISKRPDVPIDVANSQSNRVRFSDAEDKSISEIPNVGDESSFGPLLDSELANMSIYDL